MEKQVDKRKAVGATPFHLRTLTKSGGSRYLSVGTILPKDWRAVKVYVLHLDKGACSLTIVPIR